MHAIKEACGKDYPVIIRFSVESKMKGWNKGADCRVIRGPEFGRDRKEAVQAAKLLEQMLGYDALNADNGSYDAWYWRIRPCIWSKCAIWRMPHS